MTKASGGANGSNGNSKDGLSPWAKLRNANQKGGLTWNDVDPEDLRECLAAVTEAGAGLLLSKTSDGGALLIQVLDSGEKPKWYPASMAALTETLSEIAEASK